MPSEIDEGVPKVGESLSSSEAPIPIPPPRPSNTLAPTYEVGVMRRSLGYRGVHPYCDTVLSSIPQPVDGQSFQQWLALTQTACQLPKGDPSDVDVSLPDTIKLNVGAIGLEHQSGPGISRVDVPVVIVSGSLPLIGSRVLELGGGADGQSRTGSSPHQ